MSSSSGRTRIRRGASRPETGGLLAGPGSWMEEMFEECWEGNTRVAQ